MPDEEAANKVSDVEKTTATTNEEDNTLEKVIVGTKTRRMVNASLILVYGLLVSMFIVGWVSLNSCSVNKMIPVYLIVAGSTGILTRVLLQTKNTYIFNILIILIIFDICWLVFGSYVVYKEYQPNYDPAKGAYCQRAAYLLAFWVITIFYSLLALFVLLSSCYYMMRNTFKKT